MKRKTTSSHLSYQSSGTVSGRKKLKRPDIIYDRNLSERAQSDSSLVRDSFDPAEKEATINSVDKKTEAYVTNPGPGEYNYEVEIPDGAQFVRVTARVANLRNEPGTLSKIQQKLKHGDLLIRLRKSGTWVKVQALDSGEVGYVHGSLLNW